MRELIALCSVFLPWRLRRALLRRVLGYEIHPSSRIGFAWVCPRRLTMEAGARIGPLTVCRGVEHLHLGVGAAIGPANWISGMPRHANAVHFADEPTRSSNLVLGPHAAIGSRNYIDCSNAIEIGAFSRLDGLRSVLLSHSIDITTNRQRSKPVSIGAHCLVGTNCVILAGSSITDFCVIEAGSLVAGVLCTPHTQYGGRPAKPLAELPPNSAFGSCGPAALAAQAETG